MKASELTEISTKLKNCPFCGEKAELQPANKIHWRVRCKNDRCGGTNWVQTEAYEAYETWNKRAK